MSTLFGVDDLVLKADGKRVDWSRPGEVLRFVTRHMPARAARPFAASRGVGSVASRLKREGHAIVETRCERGAGVVRQLELPEAAAVAVRELDEHWDGSGQPYGIGGDEISIVGRVGCVAQNAELFLAAGGQTAMRKMLGERRGRWFEPALADALLAIGASDPIWSALQNGAAELSLARLAPEDIELDADDARLDQIAETFATIVDAKSPYTARHSHGVAQHAATIGAELGFSGAVLRDLRRGALLHDLGKLGISNTILDKPGKLDDDEFALIKAHPRLHGADPGSRPGVRAARRRGGRTPRADRRRRLPVRPAGQGVHAVHPGARRLRRVRGADRRSALSRRHVGRATRSRSCAGMSARTSAARRSTRSSADCAQRCRWPPENRF